MPHQVGLVYRCSRNTASRIETDKEFRDEGVSGDRCSRNTASRIETQVVDSIDFSADNRCSRNTASPIENRDKTNVFVT